MANNLKAFRESIGMTQKDFAESIGVAKTTYNNYEKGIRDPKSDFWIAVSRKYGVSINYLLGFDLPGSIETLNYQINEVKSSLDRLDGKELVEAQQAIDILQESRDGLLFAQTVGVHMPNEKQPAERGELSQVEIEFFNEFRKIPDAHKGLAASLCTALVRELVKHQTIEIRAEAAPA